jgi:tight adherence protein C
MVLTFSILVFVMVTGLLYFLGMKFWVTPRTAVDRIVEGGIDVSREAAHPSLAIHDLLEKLGNIVPASPGDTTTAQRRLFAAGFRSNTALKVFLGIKAVSLVALPLLTWLLLTRTTVSSDNSLFLIAGMAGLGFLGPNEVLKLLIKKRKKKITRALPNGLDLMIVCVESGLGLDQAIVQVSREMVKSYPEMSSEFAITNLEMRHGKRRAEALKNLGDRADVDDMRKLCSTLIQADRFGTSIAQSLRTHADFMRLTARQRAEEKAAKLAIKLVFPIFFCILPSLFVVTVGPVVYRIFNVLIPMMKGG